MAVGTYATKAEMILRYGEVELRQATALEDSTTGVINDSVLDASMGEANSLVDGYIQNKYTLPLSPVPPSVVGHACAITRKLLWKNNASDKIIKDHDDAIIFLRDVSRGLISLGPTSTGDAATPLPAVAYSEDSISATMTLSNLSDYMNQV